MANENGLLSRSGELLSTPRHIVEGMTVDEFAPETGAGAAQRGKGRGKVAKGGKSPSTASVGGKKR